MKNRVPASSESEQISGIIGEPDTSAGAPSASDRTACVWIRLIQSGLFVDARIPRFALCTLEPRGSEEEYQRRIHPTELNSEYNPLSTRRE
jgi:hypothetical protein